ncbi:50S ribosomal protein L6 [Candidatus Peregrinibacteria bacterium]|nr:50S ribosomal protein L6 [Candidatus Peregrinibacteria bacterium]
MSRIGKNPVQVPSDVTVTINGNTVTVKGPKGELTQTFHPNMKVEFKDNQLTVARPNELKLNKALHGLTRSLLNNMVIGVTKGYEKQLEILGVGYRAAVAGSKLTLNLGFSHPIEFNAPKGITIEVDKEKKNILIIKGADKQVLGEVASKIRGFKKPEPYKGKGIRYLGEYVPQKAGKAAAKDSK